MRAVREVLQCGPATPPATAVTRKEGSKVKAKAGLAKRAAEHRSKPAVRCLCVGFPPNAQCSSSGLTGRCSTQLAPCDSVLLGPPTWPLAA